MNIGHLRSLFLKLFIGFLSLSALIAIACVLGGEFGELQAKILATTFTISGASICAMACAAYLEKFRRQAFAVEVFGGAGIALCVLSAAGVIAGLWPEIDSELYWKGVATVSLAAVGIAYALVLRLPVLLEAFRWSQQVAAGLIAALTALIVAAIWGEIDAEGYYRLLAVVSILTVLLTLLVPIFLWLGKGSAKTTSPERLVLTPDGDGFYRDTDGRRYRVEAVMAED